MTANTDGYYFLIGKKVSGDEGGIHSEEGQKIVAYYKNFKVGGKNDNETPDAVTEAVIYPFTKNDPRTEATNHRYEFIPRSFKDTLSSSVEHFLT